MIVLLLAVVLPSAYARHSTSVPGCPDLDVLEAEVDPNIDFNNLVLCFCKVQGKSLVSISCLYGSNLDHLRKATNAVTAANFTTNTITFQHTEFADSGLPRFAELAPALSNLEVRECTNIEPLIVPEETFEGLNTTMKSLVINTCNLKEIPVAIKQLTQLETLILSNNKIQRVYNSTFSEMKELKYIDLSGNFITDIEDGSFKSLEKIETLIFGDHNYINESIIDAISRLKSLKTLDLSKADGIFEPPTELFNNLSKLELDLRVNLIENISAYAFDGLSSLNRLSLAGNYIRNLEKNIWSGLDVLEEIDLGWNEIHELPNDVFLPVSTNLKTLNLRHNPLNSIPSTSLKNLRSLILSECPLKNFGEEQLKDYTNLETIDVSKCNLTLIHPDTFINQKRSLKTLHLEHNKLNTLDPKIIEELHELELLDVSENPFICDVGIKDFIVAIENRYKVAAKEGKDFTIVNANETLCDRPYTLRHQALLNINITDLQPYDEILDTTTTPLAKTVDLETIEQKSTTPLTLPDFFIGTKTNETLFKEEPRREVYDFNTANDAKNAMNKKEKKRKVTSKNSNRAKKSSRSEDGMVEIELDCHHSTKNEQQMGKSQH
ncbi:leucine Rich repeat-containing domain protein [Dictyocaulus viviparus]|uniref:Leucine Rich repeat-containing domain protein n=1 Tax=Dictyocaulus viviparus TaxID=29172 RepID=A0A0D8XLH9_DICVI|nr:leucine Rich repeat-containing domain protein [Dictyocaulus viviparus]